MNTDETRMTLRRLERAVGRLRATVWLMWGAVLALLFHILGDLNAIGETLGLPW